MRSAAGRPALVAAAVVSLAVVAVATLPQFLGPEVWSAFAGLDAASPIWLWAAAAAFIAALVANALAWRSALALCDGRISRPQATARFCIGSLVNSLAPARLGDAVRIALFSRALPGPDRLWSVGGVFGALGAARALCLATLLLYVTASGGLPLWPVLVLGTTVAAAGVVAVVAPRTRVRTHASHLLDAFRGLASTPLQGLRIVAWVACATGARVAGVTAIAAALGVRAPVVAALILVPALDLAGLMPLTPGNLGIASGAVAVALQTKGVGLTLALSTGIALHAIESAASIALGLAGALYLARFPTPGLRLWTVRAAGAASILALATLFGATVFVDLDLL